MIDLNYINSFFPAPIAGNATFQKHILKEYVQLMVLDYLATSPYISKLAFIGGTNLRLIKGIDRFSEDLDFDCKDLTDDEFKEMTDGVLTFLYRSGINVEARDKANPKLSAFRRNIYFPEFLFELGLTGNQLDQGVNYPIEKKHVQRCGFFFPLPVPPDSVLLSMKLSALLARAKGRDFYDTMFLMQQTKPSYEFLSARVGINTPDELKKAILNKLKTIDLNVKKRDFEHLLLNVNAGEKILLFEEFFIRNCKEE